MDEEKKCKAVTTAIEYCDVYLDADHCEKCEDLRALSESRDGCFASSFILSKTDEFCA